MGGKIEVESEYGKGSTFSFILPQKIIDASPCDYDANYHGHDNNDTAIFKNEFIAPDAKALVVDDNPVNLKIACGFLKNYQLDVDTAISGEECLDMILTKKYDIIFLDYMMPRLDGIDTLQLIRAKKIDDEYFAEVPVIALTADAISSVKNKFKMVGFQEFITKPIQFQKLENVLREYLPKKYIIEKTEEQTQSDNEKADFSIPFVETDIGIENCGGTVDDYIQILEIFYKFGSDKISKIKQMLDDGNIKDYTIEVHSLKSSAANIGALEVSKLARELEMAGKEEKVEVIRNKNDDMLRKYSSLLDNIKSVLDKNN